MRAVENQRIGVIRQAVACGDFQRALPLWKDYAARLRLELSRGSLSRAEMEETGRLVAWSREVALCTRARALDQLNSLRVAAQYAEPNRPETPRLIRINL